MAKRARTEPDDPSATMRATDLAARQQAQYWVVFSYQEGMELLQGTVPAVVRKQVLGLIKRSPYESVEAYIARVEEAEA